jgi:uncharacterized membrane protein
MDRVTATNLNLEQAMSMIMTGGAVGPDRIQFSRPVAAASEISTPPVSA